MRIEYPIFAFEKDDGSMRLIESEDRILYDLEGTDIENGEYVFWDATGTGVRIVVSVGAWKSKVESVSSCSAPFPASEAFQQYAKSLGIVDLSVAEAPLLIWQQIELRRKQSKGTVQRGID